MSNVEKHIQNRNGSKLFAKNNTLLSNEYRPELDSSPELDADAVYYQSIIGILLWMVDLGRLDMCCQFSMIFSHISLPREDILTKVYTIFAYIKKHYSTALIFDHPYPERSLDTFHDYDWTKFYGDAKKAIPLNIYKPLAKNVVIRCYVNAGE